VPVLNALPGAGFSKFVKGPRSIGSDYCSESGKESEKFTVHVHSNGREEEEEDSNMEEDESIKQALSKLYEVFQP